MRTERRQELRTNELSHQLDEVREYAKKNATVLTVVIVGAAVVVGASFAYAKWQGGRQLEAWSTIERSDPDVSPRKAIEDLEAVAKQNLAPSLNVAALLKMAETAMRARSVPGEATAENTAGPSAPAKIDWAAKARDSYTEILKKHGDDAIGSLQAMIGLGVLAEDEGRYAEAREWYKKVIDDPRSAALPLALQAEYRLENLDRWSTPVVFARPQMTVPIPPGMETEAYTVPPPPPPAAGESKAAE